MLVTPIVIHEKSNTIHIYKKLSTSMKQINTTNEYSLKQNFFDPSKSSPPNEFMIKLHMRMNKHNKINYKDNKDDNLDKE